MIQIDGNHLTLEEIVQVARYDEEVCISTDGIEAIQTSHRLLNEIVITDKPVYGINTGFGIFSDRRINQRDAAALSRNLIISHAVGTGEPLPREVVRAAMLVRANTLTKGFSGARLEVVQTIIDLLNAGVTPVVPSQGSLGSSGDLLPLSHMALVFTRGVEEDESESGCAEYKGEILSGLKAMERAGLKRIRLGPKEGLAVNNGATFSAAIAALAVVDAEALLNVADLAVSMSLEAVMGCRSAFDIRLHQARGHAGQIRVAQNVLDLVKGSTLIDAAGRIQDAYSLRCAPQVNGAARDTVKFIRGVIENEVNAATDNPLIFGNGDVLSGGNFHGEPIGMTMDYLAIAITEVGAISERRIFRLTDGKLNSGLPPMLVDRMEDAGLNSGLMMPQYTAASLVLENQTLATPDSVHSLPTSGEQEDHNANSHTAARHARSVIENTAHVLAIELYTSARALDLRLRTSADFKLGQKTSLGYRILRDKVPYRAGDAWWGPEIEKVKELVVKGSFAQIFD